MSKEKKGFGSAPLTVEARTEVRMMDGTLLNAPPSAKAEPPPSEGKLTFSMYCTVKAIPVQRQAGMRAFTNINEASLSEWSAIFKRY